MGGKDVRKMDPRDTSLHVMERWAHRDLEFLLSVSPAGTPDFEEMSSEQGSL